MNVFSGLAPVIPQATKIEPDAGGDAPSVEAKTRIAMSARIGSTPAPTIAKRDTWPTALNVADDDSGPATATTTKPTNTTSNHSGRSSAPSTIFTSRSRPSCARISLAKMAQKRIAPMV